MCGAANTISNITKSPTRAFTAIGTGGGSELARLNPAVNAIADPVTKKLDSLMGWGGSSGGNSIGGGMENPAQTLAMTGGAPLLANIALGADVKQTIAGYFGASNYDKFYGSLSDSDKELVDGVQNQLTSIQSNTDLKNKAVQQIVQDFPNIAAQAAQTRQASGQEFDATTKQYLDQALQGTAAKYAANGALSSGAMAAASARVGAQYGMDKLNYMDNRGDNAYNQGVQGWQARYNEANALRNFQNLMTQGAAGQGFSAVQASLGRTQQTNLANAGFANQQNLQNQQNDNAMLGALGGLAGTAAGAYFGGPAGAAMGGKIGSSVGGMSNAPAPNSSYASFAGRGGVNV